MGVLIFFILIFFTLVEQNDLELCRIKDERWVPYLPLSSLSSLIFLHNVPIIDLSADLIGEQLVDRDGSRQAETGQIVGEGGSGATGEFDHHGADLDGGHLGRVVKYAIAGLENRQH